MKEVGGGRATCPPPYIKGGTHMDPKELIGKRFGLLTVTEDSGQRKGSSVLWRCRCDCGGEILAIRSELVSGRVTSCGCTPAPARARTQDLTGNRFGLLTVAGDSGLRTGEGVIKWRCCCDCGGEILATRQQLMSGSVTSCGCETKKYASKRQAEDLTGRQFGELTVLRRAENDKSGRVTWLCRCSCGNETVVQALRLKSGHTRSCGCKRQVAAYNKHDLAGQRFGRLTAIYHVSKNDRSRSSYWHCRCDCGNELDVCAESLLRGLSQSCGCWGREQSEKMHGHMHYQDDTCVEILRRSCSETGRNKSGFRGLFLMKNGKYRAAITFQGRHYNLGQYSSFDRAVQARLDAEEVMHRGYVRAFEQYEERARTDPAWAEENPFFYQVERVRGSFRVMTSAQETVVSDNPDKVKVPV